MWNPFRIHKQRVEERQRQREEMAARQFVAWEALWADPNCPPEVCRCSCHITYACHCKPCCYPCLTCYLPIVDGRQPEHAPKCGQYVRPPQAQNASAVSDAQ